MIKKIISYLNYDYFAQQFLNYIYFFSFRNLILKTINFSFNRYNDKIYFGNEAFNKNKNLEGWSIIILTYNINKNIKLKINKYKKIFKTKDHEIIVLTNFNKNNISIKGVRLINLKTKNITLGKKRNLAVNISNFSKIIMSLDYFIINKFKLNNLEKEISKNDLLIPKIKTIDQKRYLDWLTLDYPKIGKSLLPYNLKYRRYMYFHGSYFVFKKKFIKKNPFSNFLDHQQGEDVDWSLKVRKKIRFSLSKNIDLTVERFSYESEVLNDKKFLENCNSLIKNA